MARTISCRPSGAEMTLWNATPSPTTPTMSPTPSAWPGARKTSWRRQTSQSSLSRLAPLARTNGFLIHWPISGVLRASIWHTYTARGVFTEGLGWRECFQYRIFHPISVNQYGVTGGGIGNIVGVPDIYNLTPPCFLKASTESVSFLIQAVFALAETEIGSLDGYSSDLWFSFFKFISANKKLICDIIASGIFPPYPGMEDELRWEVNKYLKSNIKRARELRVILDGTREGLVRRLWPDLVAISCAKAGGFAHSAQLLEDTYSKGVTLVYSKHSGHWRDRGWVERNSLYIGLYVPEPDQRQSHAANIWPI